MQMKAHIELGFDGGQQGCTGHGRCAVMAGELYEVDDNGYNLHRGGTIDVPPGMEEVARTGAKVCPERAITIIE
jgi:ferredoxin